MYCCMHGAVAKRVSDDCQHCVLPCLQLLQGSQGLHCTQEAVLGELLLLRLVVECLVEDAQARLAVFKAHRATDSPAHKDDLQSLLAHSELWRLIAIVSLPEPCYAALDHGPCLSPQAWSLPAPQTAQCQQRACTDHGRRLRAALEMQRAAGLPDRDNT